MDLRQGVDGLPELPAALLGFGLGLGILCRVGDGGQVGVVQGEGLRPAAALAEQVDGRVHSETVEPRGEGGLPLEGGQALPGLQEGGLGHFLRVLRAAGFAQGQVVDHGLVALDQQGEGIRVALLGQGHQPLVIHRCAHPAAPA